MTFVALLIGVVLVLATTVYTSVGVVGALYGITFAKSTNVVCIPLCPKRVRCPNIHPSSPGSEIK